MRNFINTIKNIFAIEDLRVRILNTLGFLLVYRLGSYIILPGVNSAQLAANHGSDSGSGLVGLINIFAGGAFGRAAIFGLGIMPYISASIVVQLLGIAVPYFQKLQKEGPSGQKKIERITRVLTVFVTAFQAPGYIYSQILQYSNVEGNVTFFYIRSTLILVAGTIFVMWLGEKITDKGIGNGISLIIMIGIIARLPASFFQEFASRVASNGGGLIVLLVELVFLVAVVMATVLLVQGTRRIPVQFAKRIIGNKQYGGARQFIPLKVNASGVMPIIFAQAIMFLPITLAGFSTSATMSSLVSSLTDIGGFWYNFLFGLMIVAFTYFYTAVIINPNQMAEDMKRNGGYIPGVKPGKKTAEYIDMIMSRITLPGAVFLAIVAIMPSLAMKFGMDNQFARFYGGTSLLILVGVMMDTLQQIESYLLMRHYDGLMKTGRIKGRTSLSGATAA
ncbi:MAG: preprotein translocase subunit SecY [Bacteroidia bacterium]